MRRSTVGVLVGTVIACTAFWVWLIYLPQHDYAGRSCGSWDRWGSSGGSPRAEDDETCADLRIQAHNTAVLLTPVILIAGSVVAAYVERHRRPVKGLSPAGTALMAGLGAWLLLGVAGAPTSLRFGLTAAGAEVGALVALRPWRRLNPPP